MNEYRSIVQNKKDSVYYALKNKEFHYKILKTIENIHKNKEWKSSLIESAKRKNISELDEFIENALWLYKEEQLKLRRE